MVIVAAAVSQQQLQLQAAAALREAVHSQVRHSKLKHGHNFFKNWWNTIHVQMSFKTKFYAR